MNGANTSKAANGNEWRQLPHWLPVNGLGGGAVGGFLFIQSLRVILESIPFLMSLPPLSFSFEVNRVISLEDGVADCLVKGASS